MFALYTPDAALAAQVKEWLVTGAVMDRKARTIEVQLLCPAMPDPALLARLQRRSGPRLMAWRGSCFSLPALSLRRMRPFRPRTRATCRPRLLMKMFRRSQRLWWKLRLLPKRLLPSQNRSRP